MQKALFVKIKRNQNANCLQKRNFYANDFAALEPISTCSCVRADRPRDSRVVLKRRRSIKMENYLFLSLSPRFSDVISRFIFAQDRVIRFNR